MKTCSRCREAKPFTEFFRDNSKPEGRQYHCKACDRKAVKESRERHPERHKAEGRVRYQRHRDRNRKPWLEARRMFWLFQGGRCAICLIVIPMNDIGSSKYELDHDHSCCGKGSGCEKCRRGLLCRSCNHGIGMLQESQAIFNRAISYLF